MLKFFYSYIYHLLLYLLVIFSAYDTALNRYGYKSHLLSIQMKILKTLWWS